MVSNLSELSGIVSLEANSEASELLVTFNTDTLTVEDITAQIALTGDEVTAWKMQN